MHGVGSMARERRKAGNDKGEGEKREKVVLACESVDIIMVRDIKRVRRGVSPAREREGKRKKNGTACWECKHYQDTEQRTCGKRGFYGA